MVFSGHLECCQQLFASGAVMTAAEGILGHTSLHKAVDGNQLHVLAWLLETVKLPDVNVTDLRGHTAVAIAASKVGGHVGVCLRLDG